MTTAPFETIGARPLRLGQGVIEYRDAGFGAPFVPVGQPRRAAGLMASFARESRARLEGAA